MAEINLARAGNFLLGVEEHLLPLGDPAGSARNGEEHRKHGHGKAHRLIDEAGIEVHVRVKLALDEVFVFEGDSLQLQRDIQFGIAPGYLEDLVRRPFDDAGARIVVLETGPPSLSRCKPECGPSNRSRPAF